MEIKIFYSWQSDLPNNTNRGFIQKALEDAVKDIRNDDSIKVEPKIDKDTQGVTGSPSIPETILEKINESDIFVCDISIINKNQKYRNTPNPNVLFELGYALNKLGWNKIIMVMNQAFGKLDKLPFDLEKRRTILYNLPMDKEEKATERKALQGQLKGQIGSIIAEGEFQSKDIETIENKHPVDSFVSEINEFAKQQEFEKFHKEWKYSRHSVVDVLNSVDEIFKLIDETYASNSDTFLTSEIKLNQDKYLRSLQNPNFGSQVEITGYDGKFSNYENIADFDNVSNLFLRLVLYEKQKFGDGYLTEPIEKILLFPDVNKDKQLFWKSKDNDLNVMTPEQINRKCFELLLNKIRNKTPN